MECKDGKIYKIVSKKTGKIYIGSTQKELEKRLRGHICDYNKWLKGAKKYVSSYKIIENGDAEIKLIENYPCKKLIELLKREEYWINKLINECVNIYYPTEKNGERRLIERIKKKNILEMFT